MEAHDSAASEHELRAAKRPAEGLPGDVRSRIRILHYIGVGHFGNSGPRKPKRKKRTDAVSEKAAFRTCNVGSLTLINQG